MGSCVGKAPRSNRFKVWNINDEHVQVHKGEIEVTTNDLIYTERHTTDEWMKWPLKYLSQYGWEMNIFTFEVGRKCTIGEGRYAFTCAEAPELFNTVAHNIANLQLAGEQSPFAAETQQSVYFPRKREQPAAVSSSLPAAAVSNPAEKIDYTESDIHKTDDHPVPPPANTAKIDCVRVSIQTEESSPLYMYQ